MHTDNCVLSALQRLIADMTKAWMMESKTTAVLPWAPGSQVTGAAKFP